MSEAIRLVADGLSLAGLAIMAGASQRAWKQVPAGMTIPMPWTLQGKRSWETPKTLALITGPALATLITFVTIFYAKQLTTSGLIHNAIVFLFRTSLIGGMALVHLLQLTGALQVMAHRNQLRP
jgi:prepilin signal peptidase PulO-like enzyme (type II secretory pathway)